MCECRSEGTADGLRCPQPIERESGSDPRIRSGGKRSWRSRREPRREFSFLCEGQGTLEWVHPEREAGALESVTVPAASGELSLALENPGGKQILWVARWLALLPYNSRVPGSIPGLGLCVEFAHSPRVCLGFLRVLRFPPTVQRCAG